MAVTMALGLLAAALLAVCGGSVAHRGMPATPESRGDPALSATVAILEMVRKEPAITTLKEALARARMPWEGVT
jgi:hypothetical protein